MIKQNNRGVSPVIGIILMVAVTVGLVALAATIVFDLGSNVNEPADVSANVEFDNSDNQLTAEVIRNENAQSVSLRVPAGPDASSSGTLSEEVASGVGSTGTKTVDIDDVNDGSTSFDGESGSASDTVVAEQGTAEIVANVGSTDNEQVIETVEYDAS